MATESINVALPVGVRDRWKSAAKALFRVRRIDAPSVRQLVIRSVEREIAAHAPEHAEPSDADAERQQ